MPRPSSLPSAPSIVVALVVSLGLGIWSGERAIDALGLRAPPRGARPSEPRAGAVPGAPPLNGSRLVAQQAPPPPRALPEAARPVPGAGPAAAAPTARVEPDDAGPRTEVERAAAERLMGDLGRLVRDLEFNAELPEPPQQVVAASPEPWRPSTGAPSAAPPVIDAVEPRSGAAAGGARVTIRGRNLRPAQVMFGAEAARIVSASDQAITVVAPGGQAGSVTIAVTNDDGAYAFAGVPFRYDPR